VLGAHAVQGSRFQVLGARAVHGARFKVLGSRALNRELNRPRCARSLQDTLCPGARIRIPQLSRMLVRRTAIAEGLAISKGLSTTVMSVPPEVLFHRNIRNRYPNGLADLACTDVLDRFALAADEASWLVLVRDALNGALSEAKMNALHFPFGILYFDYIDAHESSAESFSGDGCSFIGLTIPMAKDVLRLARRLRTSADVWDAVGLRSTRSDPNSFEFLVMFLATTFIATHEYCHHVLGHQADAIPSGDPRTKSLLGNLQSQTRELAADGYAAMHLLEHVVAGGFRAQVVTMLELGSDPEPDQDRVLFLLVLISVAATWYRHPPTTLDRESVYQLIHPPRAARLSAWMEHALIWCREFRPTLVGEIDGQYFANLMYAVGVAVSADPKDADSSHQNEFMRSLHGQEYSKELLRNLDIHKSLMGT
jgi:hypothetical protein